MWKVYAVNVLYKFQGSHSLDFIVYGSTMYVLSTTSSSSSAAVATFSILNCHDPWHT